MPNIKIILEKTNPKLNNYPNISCCISEKKEILNDDMIILNKKENIIELTNISNKKYVIIKIDFFDRGFLRESYGIDDILSTSNEPILNFKLYPLNCLRVDIFINNQLNQTINEKTLKGY